MKMKLFAIALVLSGSAVAGPLDPWWMLYKVKGGDIIFRKGPYNGKYACEGDKYSLSYNHEFIRCAQ